MSVASNCSDCCDCAGPLTQWDSTSVSKSKTGFYIPGYDKFWRVLTFSGDGFVGRFYNSTDCTTNASDFDIYGACGSISYNTETEAVDVSGFTNGGGFDGPDPVFCDTAGSFISFDATAYFGGAPLGNFSIVNTETTSTKSTETECVYYPDSSESFKVISGGPLVATVSDEYTTEQLKANALAEMPAFDDDWNDTAGSISITSSDGNTYSARRSRYRQKFLIPKVRTGKCYRVEWIERFVAEGGVSIDSAEIVSRGVYRPTVSGSGGGGTGLALLAVMSSTGTVTGIRVLNPGSGYTSPPTITVQSAINGGTTSTGWTATVSNGQVTSVTGGSAGDYLPTGVIGGGGSGATISFTMDPTGGLASSPIGAGGSGYLSASSVTITPKVSGAISARIDLHFGDETARCVEWDGITPGGYDPEDDETWPILGDGVNPYFELPVPEDDGTVLVVNERVYCDCSECPP